MCKVLEQERWSGGRMTFACLVEIDLEGGAVGPVHVRASEVVAVLSHSMRDSMGNLIKASRVIMRTSGSFLARGVPGDVVQILDGGR